MARRECQFCWCNRGHNRQEKNTIAKGEKCCKVYLASFIPILGIKPVLFLRNKPVLVLSCSNQSFLCTQTVLVLSCVRNHYYSYRVWSAHQPVLFVFIKPALVFSCVPNPIPAYQLSLFPVYLISFSTLLYQTTDSCLVCQTHTFFVSFKYQWHFHSLHLNQTSLAPILCKQGAGSCKYYSKRE